MPSEENANRESINLCEGHVYLNVDINSVGVKALLDTGSSVNLIGEKLVEKLGLSRQVTEGNFKLVGVTGAPLQTLGILHNVAVVVKNVVLECDFIVTNMMNEACILGQSFLSKHHIIIDFESKTVKNNEFVACLLEGTPSNITLQVRILHDTVVTGLDVLECTVNELNTNHCNEEISGLYYIKPVDELWPLCTLFEECEPHPVLLVNGRVEIPIANETESTEIWLPKGSIIAHAVPAICSTKVVESSSSVNTNHELKETSDFDPVRVAKVIEALEIANNEELNEAQKSIARDLITEFADIFALDRSELGLTDLVYHEINLTTDVPVRAPYRRVPLHLREEAILELQNLLSNGLIEHSQSNYNTPALVIKAKNKVRIVLDFRQLNRVTSRSYATVPALNTITAGCHGATMFSSLDFKDGFLQIPLKPEHRKYTAFALPGIGFFQWRVLCLGLCSAPGSFQNMVDKILAGLPASIASVYVDDVLSPAVDFLSMVHNLRVIFARIRISRLRLNPAKTLLFRARLKFCGVILSKNGIEADSVKINALMHMRMPRTKKELRKVLGCFSWFRQHIKNFAQKAKGLTDCLKGEKFELTKAAETSIQLLKEAVCSPEVLIYPSPDLEMHVFTDASLQAVAGCIGHYIDGHFRPIAFSSKVLNDTERRWASYKREFYALWYHVTVFWRYYLLSSEFTCHVDMRSLTYDGFLKNTTQAILLRWLMDLSDYSFKLKYIQGKYLDVPDCLSRLPQDSQALLSWWTDSESKVTMSSRASENEIVHSKVDAKKSTARSVMVIREMEPVCRPYVTSYISCVKNFPKNKVHCMETIIEETEPIEKLEYVKSLPISHNPIEINLHLEVVSNKVKTNSSYIDNLKHVDQEKVSVETNQQEAIAEYQNMILYTQPVCIKVHSVTVNTCILATHEADVVEPNEQEDLIANPENNLAQQLDNQVENGTNNQNELEQQSVHQPLGSFLNPLPAHVSKIIKKAQEVDNDFKEVHRWLELKKKPTEQLIRAGFGPTLLKCWLMFEHIRLSADGTVCYNYYLTNSKKFIELLYVPKSLRSDIISAHHSLEASGHLGPMKTLFRLRAKYFFEGITAEVKQFCATCEVCFLNNHTYQRNAQAPLKLFPANRPGQYLSIDLIGEIHGPGRYRWILTMVDRFTRFVRAVPLINATSETIAQALMKHWFWVYGVPECLLSDRGGNLTTSHTIKMLYNLMSVFKLQTTSYHARGNGQCESYNKHLVVVLKKLVDNDPKQWFRKLDQAVFALNTSVCSTTGFSAYKLHMGREVRVPADLIYDTTTTEFYKSGGHLAAASYYEMREVFDLVRANNMAGQMRQKVAYDRKRKFHTTYKVGDHVLLWKPISPKLKDLRKFRNCYSGPWEIVKVISSWTYVVKNVSTKKEEVVHFDSLKFVPTNLRKENVNFKQLEADSEESIIEKAVDSDLYQTMFGTRTKPTVLNEDEHETPPDINGDDLNEASQARHGYFLRSKARRAD